MQPVPDASPHSSPLQASGYGPGGYGPPGGGYGPPPGGGYGPPQGAPPGGGYGPPQGAPPGGGYGPPQGGPPGGGYGPPQGGPPAPPPKKSNVGLIVGLVVGGVVLLGALTALAIIGFGKYMQRAGEQVSDGKGGTITLPAKMSSKAHVHLPSGCELVMRLDVAQVLALPAVQKHLVPALDELKAKSTDTKDDEQLQEMLVQSGIDPKADLHDVVLCGIGMEQKGNEKILFVVGGELRPESVVPAIEKVDSPKPTVTTFDGRKVASGKDKKGKAFFVGQAADGAILFATDEALFQAATKEGAAWQSEYALATNAEVGMVLTKSFVERTSSGAGANPLTRDFKSVTRVGGTLMLANPRAELRLSTASANDAKKLNQATTALLALLKRGAAKEKSQAGEFEALAAAKSRLDGNDVVLEAPWTSAGVEQAAAKLAEVIRGVKKNGNLSLDL